MLDPRVEAVVQAAQTRDAALADARRAQFQAGELARAEFRRALEAALAEGVSMAEVARALGVSRQRVFQMTQHANGGL